MNTTRRFEHPGLGESFREELLGDRLRVVLYEKPGFRRTFALLIARFGGGDMMLPDGTPIPEGMAHFFEHRLFTKLDGDISTRFSALGLSVNAATGLVRTAFHFTGSEHLAAGIELLLELVLVPHFPAEGVEMERQIIRREIAEHEASATTHLYRNLHHGLYHAHPVRREVLGSESTLGDITPTLLYRCHEAFYCPENLVLFLYGGAEEEVALRALERYLEQEAPPQPGRYIPPPDVEEPPGVVRSRIEQRHRVVRPHVAMGFKIRPGATRGRAFLEESILTQVCLDVTFGTGTRWYEEQYASGLIDDSFDAACNSDHGYAYVSVTGETGDPEGFEEAICERSQAVLEGGVEEDALRRVQRRMVGNFLRYFNTPEDALGLFANYHLQEANPLECVELARMLDAERIAARLQELLRLDRRCTSILRPRNSEDPGW
jgi:predicted Zn-dependent peptidase